MNAQDTVRDLNRKAFLNALADCGLSQAEFSRVAGVHKSTVTQWMNHRDVPIWAVNMIRAKVEYRRRLNVIADRLSDLESLVREATF